MLGVTHAHPGLVPGAQRAKSRLRKEATPGGGDKQRAVVITHVLKPDVPPYLSSRVPQFLESGVMGSTVVPCVVIVFPR